ncbi:hypothetical protein Unana1_07781 [Umbelopsis nana]
MDSTPASGGSSWSEVARRGLQQRIPNAKLRSKPGQPKLSSNIKTEIVYEVEGFTEQQRSQRAAAILRRAPNPDAVNFEFSNAKLDPVLIVDEIAQQPGEAIGYTNLSLYRRESKGLISKSSLARQRLPKPVEAWKVLQVRKYTESLGRFLGEASIILDRDDGNTVHEYLDLSRMVYLEDDDTYVPATYQDAPKHQSNATNAKDSVTYGATARSKDNAKPVENLYSVVEVVEEEENDASSTSTDVPPPVVAGNSPSAEVEMEMDSNMDSQEGSVVEVPNPTESLTQEPIVDESMVVVSEEVPPLDIEPVISTKEALAMSTASSRPKRKSTIDRPGPYAAFMDRSRTSSLESSKKALNLKSMDVSKDVTIAPTRSHHHE